MKHTEIVKASQHDAYKEKNGNISFCSVAIRVMVGFTKLGVVHRVVFAALTGSVPFDQDVTTVRAA